MLIKVNGVDLYYEKTGEGSPVILAHGNGENHDIFDVLTAELSKNHTVYAVDSRGHGLSTPVTSFSYQDMMKDYREMIGKLKLEKPAFYGFSDGGIIGLLLACTYPEVLSCLAVSGANLRPFGMYGRFYRETLAEYRKSRNPLTKLMLTQPWISHKELLKITAPVLVLAGEHDVIKKKHTQEIASSIKDSRLVIVPGEDHGSYVVHSEKLYPLIAEFIDGGEAE